MYARPKPEETDEDLLRMQEEYFKNKAGKGIKPAAKVVTSHSEESTTAERPVEAENSENEDNKADIKNQLANTFEAIPTDMKINAVVEKKQKLSNVGFKFDRGRGFPQAKRRDPNIAVGKGSIFSQQIKRLKTGETPMETDSPPINTFSLNIKENTNNPGTSTSESIQNVGPSNLPSKSFILTGSDSNEIHKQNVSKLKSMSESEILEEKEKLLATMDPAIVAFLKSRRKTDAVANKNPTIKEQNEAGENIEIEAIETATEIVSKPESEKWLNFNVVEANKLAWMKNVDIPKMDKNQSFEARFDFEGWLLPYSEPNINEKNRILYHHGEEAGRPGYTLQELFQLSRSNVIQQKIVALNCIGNILSLNSTGIYDNIIEIPIEQIFFVVRICLDDNTPAVLNASVKCMRNLVYFQLDETCLDNLLGFGLGIVQPILSVENEHEDDNTVNDQQLVESNLTKCLARTEIFTRIKYIINTVRPPLETIVYCIEILIRLARDSDFIATKLFNREGVLDSIVKYFFPRVISPSKENPGYGIPLSHVVKLLRILCSRSKSIAYNLLTKYSLIDTIITCLSDDTFSANANGMKLQIECFRLWTIFVNYEMTFDYIKLYELPVLLKILDYHFKNTNNDLETTLVRQSHVASLLVFIAQVSKRGFLLNNQIYSLLSKCAEKWITQLMNVNKYTCGKLQIISSLIYCFSNLVRQQNSLSINDAILKGLSSQSFKNLTRNIRNGSMLLNNYETHKTSANLKSLESAAWHTMDHVVPVLQTNSCLPFLFSLSEYVLHCDNNQVKSQFLKHENIQEYLHLLQKSKTYYLISNWFTRCETFILMNILKVSVQIKDALDTSIFYELSVKCLSIFNSEQKADIEYLLSNIIFCSKFYPSHVLLGHLDISQRNASLELSLNHLPDILQVYSLVLGLKNNIFDSSTSLSIDINTGNTIPIDWIYTPIIVLYSNQQQNKSTASEEQQIFTIKNCLRWILIYESYFPSLANTINPTDRFCRLACVFLGSDNLFLNAEIHDFLELCFKNVAKFEKSINFKKEIQGLSNFQDFYTQLLEQYQAVSYGDVLFGNIILIPLAQKHNIQFRKTLWSEYMGVVQIFNVTPEQIFFSLDSFLEPPETEISLLNCYRRALSRNTIRKHSVLYKIAYHHVQKFMETQQKSN